MPQKKGFAAFIVIVVSFLIIFTLTFVSFKSYFSQVAKNQLFLTVSQLDPLHGWQTYTNDAHNFTIRYPKEWYVKSFESDSADFTQNDPQKNQTSPSALTVRFSSSSNAADVRNFEKIYKLKDDQKILEPLDVRSQLTKNKNLKIGNFRAIDYQIDRTFSALEGPRREFQRIYEVNKEGTVLKFSNSSPTLEEQQKLNDVVLSQMISSLKFK